MPAGRPRKYTKVMERQVYKLCLLGATDVELADFLEIALSTLNKWKHDFPKFSESLKKGKQMADAEVANALFHRAKGYSHPEDKIFNDNGEALIVKTRKHYPPDATSAIFWLKNRDRDRWRDRQELDVTSNRPILIDLSGGKLTEAMGKDAAKDDS